jgi:hypothetical protein
MWRDLEFLCGFDRTSGTDGERRAMNYIAGALRAEGIRVDVHEFDAYLSYPVEGRIDVVAGSDLTPSVATRTRAFSTNTPPDGVTAELVYVAGGHDIFRDVDTYKRLDAARISGKIVLSEAGSRRNMQAAQANGAVAYVHMWPSDEDAIHEGIVSPVWGAPTPDHAGAFPRIPMLSITNASGHALRAAMERGPVRLRVHSKTETGWKRVTLPVATIPGKTPDFVLFSGHVDSWYLGATDNATGNVVTMEVARIAYARRGELRRGVRCAFWPGHSTGRYAGSTWYADQAYSDLAAHCVVHVNCDSPGVSGATDYEPVTATAEAGAFAKALIKRLAGQTVSRERPVRAGDQSFWGAGVPSLLMGSSMRPKGKRWLVGGSGLGWWWHTDADTIDKVERDVLLRDTKIYLTAAYRFATDAVPPLRVTDAVDELAGVARDIAKASSDRFDMEPVTSALARLRRSASRFDRATARLARLPAAGRAAAPAAGPAAAPVAIANRAQHDAVAALVRVGYVAGNPFDHDPAVPQPALPALNDARELASMDPASHDSQVLRTQLVRRRNRIVHDLTDAAETLEAALVRLR